MSRNPPQSGSKLPILKTSVSRRTETLPSGQIRRTVKTVKQTMSASQLRASAGPSQSTSSLEMRPGMKSVISKRSYTTVDSRTGLTKRVTTKKKSLVPKDQQSITSLQQPSTSRQGSCGAGGPPRGMPRINVQAPTPGTSMAIGRDTPASLSGMHRLRPVPFSQQKRQEAAEKRFGLPPGTGRPAPRRLRPAPSQQQQQPRPMFPRMPSQPPIALSLTRRPAGPPPVAQSCGTPAGYRLMTRAPPGATPALPRMMRPPAGMSSTPRPLGPSRGTSSIPRPQMARAMGPPPPMAGSMGTPAACGAGARPARPGTPAVGRAMQPPPPMAGQRRAAAVCGAGGRPAPPAIPKTMAPPARARTMMGPAQIAKTTGAPPRARSMGAPPAARPATCGAARQQPSRAPASTTPAPQYLKRKPSERVSLAPPRRGGSKSNTKALEASVQQELLAKSATSILKVRAQGARSSKTCVPVQQMLKGKAPVLQQITMEKRVDKNMQGEHVSRTLTGVDVGPSGMAKQVDINVQQMDPDHAAVEEEDQEVISVVSSITVTQNKRQFKRSVTRTSGKAEDLIDPAYVSQLVDEENKEIENTARKDPVKIVEPFPGKYSLKKKQVEIQLTADTVKELEQSVVMKPARADEAQVEPPPETIANIMNCLERGRMAESLPTQVFNNLYPEGKQDRYVNISSVIPGRLADAVVPIDVPNEMKEATLTEKEECLMKANNIPEATTFTDAKIEPPKGKKPQYTITDETPPWAGEYKSAVTESVGAVECSDLSPQEEVIKSPVNEYIENGIEYFIEAEKIPYECKIQLRGSQPPLWFPGFVMAVPELPNVITVAKTPSQVFYTAWKSVQPKYFPDDSITLI